jgi:PLP dependent protein
MAADSKPIDLKPTGSSEIVNNIAAVRSRIAAACQRFAVPENQIKLLAVSKTFPASAIQAAFHAGLTEFGENYVQEGVEKIQALSALQQRRRVTDHNAGHNADHHADHHAGHHADQHPGSSGGIVWHFIGPLQSNKTKDIAEHFDWMHTVDRMKIARRLSEQRPKGLAPLQVCIQINISGEASKSGVTAHEAPELAEAIAELPGLTLRGLMAIPEPATEFDQQRAPFEKLCELFGKIKAALPTSAQQSFNVLSMGMSADLEAAIAASAPLPRTQTIVRVGSAIFGQRS